MISCLGFPGGSVVKNPPAHAGDAGDSVSISGSGRSPGGGNGSSLQCSHLGNYINRGAWQITVMGLPKVGHNLVTKHRYIGETQEN